MDKLIFGLTVALIGMLVVFAGLVLLIYCIKLITLVSTERKAKPAAEGAASVGAPIMAAPVAKPLPAAPQGVSPEIIAAITAAIAAVWQGDTGFVVRHVRRVHNAPAWNRAGREDQIYSRM